jgi:hypothetical protein
VYFPPDKAGNVLRGALGISPGFADMAAPRPFVLRAAKLDGQRFAPGETFSIDVNVFDLRGQSMEMLAGAFSEWGRTGLGPRRGRVELTGVEDEAIAIDLAGGDEASKCSLQFCTPTELKGNASSNSGNSGNEMPFGILFARLRNRIGALYNLYGEGAMPVDFPEMPARARLIRTVRCDLQYREVWRRSSRTGAVHGIGGVTGRVDYEGELTEFLPWLRAAWWTGVGRHTVWGNGAVEVVHAE